MHINLSLNIYSVQLFVYTIGNPTLIKRNQQYFLKIFKLKNWRFSNMIIDKNFTDLVFSNVKPVIDNIFTNVPIYKIDKSSFRRLFCTRCEDEDSFWLLLDYKLFLLMSCKLNHLQLLQGFINCCYKISGLIVLHNIFCCMYMFTQPHHWPLKSKLHR